MIVAVASGKGGTGKTTVSASLARVWDRPLAAVDLDVEEPNLHLFLNPDIRVRETVALEIPVVDESKCTLCRQCSELCQFKAITVMADTLLTFPEMCHGCGGCLAICPEKALSPGRRELGTIETGTVAAGDVSIEFMMGTLRISEAMSPPLMREVKHQLDGLLAAADGPEDAVVDAPPGVSCPAVTAVMDADLILLVTEPTPFGYHDFKLAHEAFSPFGKPMGVVINRAGLGDASVQEYCAEHKLPVLAEIPYDRAIAAGYSQGRLVADISPELRQTFIQLRDGLRNLAAQEASHA